MSNCSPLHSSKGAACLALRVSFGLSILCMGLTHYMDFQAFSGMVYEDLGALSFLGVAWAYVLPALYILGGALMVINMFPIVSAWSIGLGLGSVAAGLMLKPVLSGAPLSTLMPSVTTALTWMLVYYFVVKCSACCGCGGACQTEEK